jgi:integrase
VVGLTLPPRPRSEMGRRATPGPRQAAFQPSQVCRKRINPAEQAGDRYTVASYRHAIQVACDKAGVPRWHPHQLRHNAATWLRREFGLEIARVVLGHSSPVVTEMDAEMDRQKAIAVIERVG